jgi:hypothetical protein
VELQERSFKTCGATTGSNGEIVVNEEEAVGLATRFAQQQGYDASQYKIRASKPDEEWRIFFQRNGSPFKPRPGDFFTVYVDDKSRSARRLVHGK